jgi:hypothetical protein
VSNNEKLCEIDEAIVQLECDGTSYQRSTDIMLVADLMQLLAFNWEQRGTLDRADQLYQKAYDLQGRTPANLALGKIATLQGWAILKVKLGQPERAKEFAKLQTELARNHYQPGDAGTLIQALEFQGAIFEQVGSPAEASAVREEARRLSALAGQCQGICSYRCDGPLCPDLSSKVK